MLHVVLKFQEGTRIRLRGNALVPADRGARENERLAELGLTEADIRSDLVEVHQLLAGFQRGRGLARLFELDEATLEELRAQGEARGKQELADLDLYYIIPLHPATKYEEVAELVAALNALRSVEIAYAEAPAENAVAGEIRPMFAPITTNLQSQQGYLNPAPQGIDALYAWTFPGGKGAGVRIVDVERAWRTTHEDMPTLFHRGGTQLSDVDSRSHGTAVLGEMVAKDNGFGVTGIVNQAQAGYESAHNTTVSSAISKAAVAAGPGGIVLIEQHQKGPANSSSCTCNTPQCDYIAMEYWQANYDAIATAVANGVIVVEAAGNGSSNLDDPAYGNLFNRSTRDSGAILVAASGASTSRFPTCWTNWGSRIDLHGWGEGVVTMGYGDHPATGFTEDTWYTHDFGGTSSASPIVTGAAAAVQGVAYADGRRGLDSRTMRQLLRDTGTPQSTSTSKNIGPLPNLRAALDRLNSYEDIYACTVDVVTGANDCVDNIVTVTASSGSQRVLTIDLGLGYRRLDAIADVCNPSGWVMHFTDSPTGDGGGGDNHQTDHDTETWLLGNAFELVGPYDDGRSTFEPLVKARNIIPASGCSQVHWTLQEDELLFDDDGNPSDSSRLRLASIFGFELGPYNETDTEDASGVYANTWHAGINRTVGAAYRAGSGVNKVCFVVSTSATPDPFTISSLCAGN